MKKRKIKFLTTAACLALIGSASAAWVYSGTATASANIGVKVASYASAGSITLSGVDKINVLLDKGSVSYVRDSENDTLTAKHNVPKGFESASNTVTKQFSVIISPTLANYVTFDSTYGNAVVELTEDLTALGDFTIPKGSIYLTVANDDRFFWTDDTDLFSKLPTLAWKENKEPSSENEYKNLINSFKTGTISDSNWDSVKNSDWNVTSDLNSDVYVQLLFIAFVN